MVRAGGAAVDLDMPLALGPQHEVEGLAAIGQSLHGIDELGGRRLVKPLLEAEQAVWLRRHAKPVRQARGMHPRAGLSGPGQQHLRLGRKDGLEHALACPIALRLEVRRVACPERGLRRP